jgi:hypothetical protein
MGDSYYTVKLSGPDGGRYLHLDVPLHLVEAARRRNVTAWSWIKGPYSPAGGYRFDSEKAAKYKMRLDIVRRAREDPNFRVEIIECVGGTERVVYPKSKPTILDRLAAI